MERIRLIETLLEINGELLQQFIRKFTSIFSPVQATHFNNVFVSLAGEHPRPLPLKVGKKFWVGETWKIGSSFRFMETGFIRVFEMTEIPGFI